MKNRVYPLKEGMLYFYIRMQASIFQENNPKKGNYHYGHLIVIFLNYLVILLIYLIVIIIDVNKRIRRLANGHVKNENG